MFPTILLNFSRCLICFFCPCMTWHERVPTTLLVHSVSKVAYRHGASWINEMFSSKLQMLICSQGKHRIQVKHLESPRCAPCCVGRGIRKRTAPIPCAAARGSGNVPQGEVHSYNAAGGKVQKPKQNKNDDVTRLWGEPGQAEPERAVLSGRCCGNGSTREPWVVFTHSASDTSDASWPKRELRSAPCTHAEHTSASWRDGGAPSFVWCWKSELQKNRFCACAERRAAPLQRSLCGGNQNYSICINDGPQPRSGTVIIVKKSRSQRKKRVVAEERSVAAEKRNLSFSRLFLTSSRSSKQNSKKKMRLLRG